MDWYKYYDLQKSTQTAMEMILTGENTNVWNGTQMYVWHIL